MLKRLWDRYAREIVLLGALVLVGLGRLAAGRLGIDWSASSVRELVADLGVWGPALFVALVTFRQLILIPSQILLVAGGLCFGITAGTLYGGLGIAASATLVFLLARYAGKEAMLSRVPPEMRPLLDAASRRAGPALVAIGTGYPVGPLTAYHAGAGITSMPLGTFVVAVAAGGLVRGLVFTSFGSAIMQGMGTQLLVAGLLLLVAATLPLLSSRARRWLLGTDPGPAVADAAPGPAAPDSDPVQGSDRT